MANGGRAHDGILQAVVTGNWLDSGATNGGARADVLIVVGSSSGVVLRVAIIIIIINEG